MTKSKPLLRTFVILASIATLFPPYNWGEEKLATDPDKARTYALPVKKYAFILGDSTRSFDISEIQQGNDSGGMRIGSGEILTLNRKMILSDLIIEYLLCFLIALVVHRVVLKRKSL